MDESKRRKFEWTEIIAKPFLHFCLGGLAFSDHTGHLDCLFRPRLCNSMGNKSLLTQFTILATWWTRLPSSKSTFYQLASARYLHAFHTSDEVCRWPYRRTLQTQGLSHLSTVSQEAWFDRGMEVTYYGELTTTLMYCEQAASNPTPGTRLLLLKSLTGMWRYPNARVLPDAEGDIE